jgi:SseB protein N-terminal domain
MLCKLHGGITVFEPQNGLEALMQAAARDPSVVPAFYKTLLETEIYILTPETPMTPGRRRSLKLQEKINVATVEFQGMQWHPAFTSKKRISDYLKEPETCLGAIARDLFEMLPNSNFWLNPLSECQKPLPADEIALLRSGEISDALKTTVRVFP